MTSKFHIQPVTWASHAPALRYVREQVFIHEQHVPVDLEWDDLDADASHLLAYFENQPIACARIIHYQSIGRMAVAKEWRNHGLGRAMLFAAIQVCQQHGGKLITLSAQTHAIAFYEKAGFTVCSQSYWDANILHVDMQLTL